MIQKLGTQVTVDSLPEPIHDFRIKLVFRGREI
jgi:hypothetical protein